MCFPVLFTPLPRARQAGNSPPSGGVCLSLFPSLLRSEVRVTVPKGRRIWYERQFPEYATPCLFPWKTQNLLLSPACIPHHTSPVRPGQTGKEAAAWFSAGEQAILLTNALSSLPHRSEQRTTQQRLVVSVVDLAVVANQLEPADHLANGEEAQALGKHHAAGHHLCPREVPELLGVDVLEDGAGSQLRP